MLNHLEDVMPLLDISSAIQELSSKLSTLSQEWQLFSGDMIDNNVASCYTWISANKHARRCTLPRELEEHEKLKIKFEFKCPWLDQEHENLQGCRKCTPRTSAKPWDQICCQSSLQLTLIWYLEQESLFGQAYDGTSAERSGWISWTRPTRRRQEGSGMDCLIYTSFNKQKDFAHVCEEDRFRTLDLVLRESLHRRLEIMSTGVCIHIDIIWCYFLRT